jgi:hypothetical protein
MQAFFAVLQHTKSLKIKLFLYLLQVFFFYVLHLIHDLIVGVSKVLFVVGGFLIVNVLQVDFSNSFIQ